MKLAYLKKIFIYLSLNLYYSYYILQTIFLRVFYQSDAFLCDSEKMEAFRGYLKALSKLKISAPANSSFLNNWTPTPLIMAGLCFEKVKKGYVLSSFN